MPSHSTHMHHHKRPARVGPNTTKNTIFLKKNDVRGLIWPGVVRAIELPALCPRSL